MAHGYLFREAPPIGGEQGKEPLMRRSAGLLVALILALLVAAILPSVAAAAAFRSGNAVVVGPNETVDDDLYISGNSVQVLGTVNGDVIAAGQNVDIGGNVTGSVMAAGQSVRIDARVGGTVRAAGSDVQISSAVGRDVLAAGSSVQFERTAIARQDALLAGSFVSLAGRVGRDAALTGSSVIVSGNIGDDANIEAETLRVLSGARIRSNLSYSANDASVQGTVMGATEKRPSPQEREREQKVKERSGKAAGAFIFWAFIYWIRALIGYVIFGLIVVLVFKRFSADGAVALAARPWPSLGWGALVGFAFPVAFVPAFALGLIIGGWWIALLALFAWFTLLAIGLVIGALTIGRLIVSRGQHPPHDVWAMLLGLAILWIVWLIPIVGMLVMLVAMLFGVGGVVLAIANRRSAARAAIAEGGAASAASGAAEPTSPSAGESPSAGS